MSIIHIPFYPSDWLAGTRGMSDVETGVYITLIATMYEMAGPIERDDQRLYRTCGSKSRASFVKALDYLISEGKIIEVDGGLFNEKVGKVINITTEKSEKAKAAAQSRWDRKPNKTKERGDANASAKHMPQPCQPEPEPYKKESTNVLLCDLPSSKPDRFDEFWERYPRKIAKPNAKKAYAKALKAHRHDDIMFGLSQHLSLMQGKEAQFIPHAATWLNGERFNDEPEQPTNNTNQRNPGIGSGTARAAAAVAERRIAGKGRCDGSDW